MKTESTGTSDQKNRKAKPVPRTCNLQCLVSGLSWGMVYLIVKETSKIVNHWENSSNRALTIVFNYGTVIKTLVITLSSMEVFRTPSDHRQSSLCIRHLIYKTVFLGFKQVSRFVF